MVSEHIHKDDLTAKNHSGPNILPFCSNLARVTDIGIFPPGRRGDPSKICKARATEGS